MKANEVRRLNLVEFEGKVYEIHTIAEEFPTLNISEFGVGVVDWNNINPIPITEDWLLKFGYGIDKEFDDHFIDNVSRKQEIMRYSTYSKIFTIESNGGDVVEIEINYIHQLQNLYFALCGEELEVKNELEKM